MALLSPLNPHPATVLLGRALLGYSPPSYLTLTYEYIHGIYSLMKKHGRESCRVRPLNIYSGPQVRGPIKLGSFPSTSLIGTFLRDILGSTAAPPQPRLAARLPLHDRRLHGTVPSTFITPLTSQCLYVWDYPSTQASQVTRLCQHTMSNFFFRRAAYATFLEE